MKTNRSRSKNSAEIKNSRWLAYATAGAASALAGATSVQASIHYSGRIDEYTGWTNTASVHFQLDQPGDSFWLKHSVRLSFTGYAHFRILGRAGADFAGFYSPCDPQIASVSKLSRGQLISRRPFLARNSGLLAGGGGCGGQFDSGDFGFIGFKFNNGSGDQYGWVRLKFGYRNGDFWLVDYAYADPGEPIRAGQSSSNEMVPEENEDVVPQEGSLGALALGAAGLLAWRKRRSQAPR
jgi:hypothetical protein